MRRSKSIGPLLMPSNKLSLQDTLISTQPRVQTHLPELILVYRNEEQLGFALKEVNKPREELFITTKVLSNIKDPEKALKTSLERLQIDYVDLYLIHSPFGVDLEKAWPAMEALKDQGKSRNCSADSQGWQRISGCPTLGSLISNASSRLQSTSQPSTRSNSIRTCSNRNCVHTSRRTVSCSQRMAR